MVVWKSVKNTMQISSIIDEDIWKSDRKTIDTQKVVFSLWQNRDNATSISTLASTLRLLFFKISSTVL